ncbi:MAG: hypothetical protein J5819_04485 [Eubacterium sp.]|nr:hypothetical protein [Eubacterium sp.]
MNFAKNLENPLTNVRKSLIIDKILQRIIDGMMRITDTIGELTSLTINNSWQSPLGIETEKQLWDHIDQSLEHAKTGVGRDADDVISDFRRKVL